MKATRFKCAAQLDDRLPVSQICSGASWRQLIAASQTEPGKGVVHEKENQKGNRNRATVAVARKMVAYVLAMDRQERWVIHAEQRLNRAALEIDQ